jgi:hypothetical protein
MKVDQDQDRGLCTRKPDEEAQGQEGDCLDLETVTTKIGKPYNITWQSSRHFDEVQHMADKRYKRRKVIDTLLKAYALRSVSLLLKLLAPEFQHQTLPDSLGFPVRDRAAFADHAKQVFAIFAWFEMVPQAIIDDLSTDTVAIHANMRGALANRGETSDASDDDDDEERKDEGEEIEGMKIWTNECVLLVTLNDANDSIVEIREFVDSAKAKDMASKHAPEVFGDGVVPADNGPIAKNNTKGANTNTSTSTQMDIAAETSTSVDTPTNLTIKSSPARGPAHTIGLGSVTGGSTRPRVTSRTASDTKTSTSPDHGIRVIPVRNQITHKYPNGQTNSNTYTRLNTYTYMDAYSREEDPFNDIYYLPHLVKTWRFIYGYRNSRIAMAAFVILVLALCAHTYMKMAEAYHLLFWKLWTLWKSPPPLPEWEGFI